MSLRDELAAVLGPGNDDATAYAQADAVLEVLARQAVETVLDVLRPSAVLLTPHEARLTVWALEHVKGWPRDLGWEGSLEHSHARAALAERIAEELNA